MNMQTELFKSELKIKQKSKSILPRKNKPMKGLFIKENDVPATYRADSVDEDQIIEKAFEIIAKRFDRSNALTSPDLTIQFLTLHFARQDYESFCAVWLDNQHRVIDVEELFIGTIDGASVYPREVVKSALAHNAAAVIFSHNHPSGNNEPSEADKFITFRLKECFKLFDIRILDHVIIAGTKSFSFANAGLI